MKYETPDLIVLSVAIDTIQAKPTPGNPESGKEAAPAYEDWE
jgi:hypothetical protein